MTAKEIYGVMRDAGFDRVVAESMTAIALRESGGDPNSFNGNTNTGDRSYGLVQINLLNDDIRKFLIAKIPELAENEKLLLDPATNAKAAFALYRGHVSFLNVLWYINRPGGPNFYQERYEKHLPEAHTAALESV